MGDRQMRTSITTLIILLGSLAIAGCSGGKDAQAPAPAAPAATAAAKPADDAPLPPLALESALPEEVRAELNEKFTGDLDAMVKRRLVRVGVTYNRTHYFIDKGVQRGITYEYIKLMEDELNKRRKTGNLKVAFWPIPLPRDQLLPALADGKLDLVIAQLTVTPERQKIVDFSNPTRENVDEIVVTGAGAPPINSVEDLSGQEVFVRTSSSYYHSLLALNERLKAAGKAPVVIKEAPDALEDDDLLEMANAGLVRIIVVDNYLADFWKQVFPNITVHDKVAVSTGGKLAVAFRKNSPQVAKGVNAIVKTFGRGSAFGNTMEKRYLQNTTYVKSATSEAERKRFLDLVNIFKKYGDQYDVDYLLMAAQGYQESRLDHSVRSPVGAIGVMQVMPATGKELKVGDITQLDANINAGVKYMRFVMDTYYKDEPMTRLDKGLFAFASYNAGPGRIRQLRAEAQKRGLDPNVWFGNVEQIASERIGRETVTYVSNIYKYYIAYRLLVEERERRDAAKAQLKATTSAPAR
jgi:membrane-bound lytic murein transglycosylase MltF